MSEDTPRVICIGEALIEMTRGPDGAFTAACVGDSFNTAQGRVWWRAPVSVYARRIEHFSTRATGSERLRIT